MNLPWVLTAGLAAVVLTATAAGLVTPPTLRRLPEPELATGEHKPLYTDLPPPPLAWGAAAWAAALALATVTSLPANKWAPFLVVALVGSVGCIIDAATTWLPRRILHVGWLLTPLALVLSTAWSASAWSAVVRAAVGALITGVLLLAAHLWAGFGLSDARLGLLTGAIAAWISWDTLLAALFLGSVVGAGWGLVHSWQHGRGTPFPYGPSLLFGPYLAVLANAVVR